MDGVMQIFRVFLILCLQLALQAMSPRSPRVHIHPFRYSGYPGEKFFEEVYRIPGGLN